MYYALLNGVRVEPKKGLEGTVCPFCRQSVIARCGEERVAIQFISSRVGTTATFRDAKVCRLKEYVF